MHKYFIAINNFLKKYISTVKAVLILFLVFFFFMAAMPFVKTTYVIPSDNIETNIKEEYIGFKNKNSYIRGVYALNFGLYNYLNLSLETNYIHKDLENNELSGIGDSSLSIWYYISDIPGLRSHWGLWMEFNVPTGENVYEQPGWKNLSFGNHEIKIGPVFSFDINPGHLFVNLFYNFREGSSEDFYQGLSYDNYLGFKIKDENAFFAKERLKNDYIEFSSAYNVEVCENFIVYFGSYVLCSFNNSSGDSLDKNESRDSFFSLLTGFKIFFNEKSYLSFSYADFYSSDISNMFILEFLSEF